MLKDFDYKKLLVKPLEVIGDYLNDSNLQFFAKLLPKLPTELKLSSSKIHVIWCLKNFWALLENDNEWTNESINAFIDKFETLVDSLRKLDLETDFIHFVHETLISEKSCLNLNVQVRKNLVKKFTKFLKQEQNKQQLSGRFLFP